MTLNIDTMTIAEARQVAAMFGALAPQVPSAPHAASPEQAVVVCTDKRGVFFGYTTDPLADPINLRAARMCIYWTSKVGGVAGLAATGPKDATKSGNGSRIAAESDAILRGITAVFPATPEAVAAWSKAPVYTGE